MMNGVIKYAISLVLMTCVLHRAASQDVGIFFDDINKRIASKDYLNFSGNLSANIRYNHISGINRRVDAFTSRINAAILVDFLGIKGPFSAAFSDGNLAYNLPAYGFYGFSPSYKWIQMHLGDRSMDFSPYSLSGHNFKGIGIEIKPGKFYFGAMSGRLLRARSADAGAIQNLDPIYKRIGRGVKLGYDDGDNQLGVILFHAKDIEESIQLADSSKLRPQENLVMEFQGKKALGKLIEASFDLAHSSLTRDKTAPLLPDPPKGLNGANFGLLTPHSSTGHGQAWNFALAFRPAFAGFTLGIEHISAGYQSLGRLAFLNDTENITLGVSTSLLKKKITLAGNLGVQRNGLSTSSTLAGARLIGSANVSILVSERLNVSGALSNLNYTMRQRVSPVPILVVDSIIIVQSNLSAQLTSAYLIGADKQSVLSLSAVYQNANSITDDQVNVMAENTFYSGMISYTMNIPDNGTSLTASLLSSFTQVSDTRTSIISPTLAFQQKMLGDKLNIQAGLSTSFLRIGSISGNRLWQGNIGGQWKLSKKHALRSQLAYVSNTSSEAGTNFPSFTDINFQVGYMLNF
jgi:hypothetical protein